jgi:hypothetical protein
VMLARPSSTELSSSPFYLTARASLCATHFAKLRNLHILSPSPYSVITHRAFTDVMI